MEILPPWLASQARPVLTGRFHLAEDVLRTMLVYFVCLPETYGPLLSLDVARCLTQALSNSGLSPL